MSEQAMTTSGGSHHHPTPQAPRLSSLVPLLWLVLIPLIAALLGLLFETWLAETRKPPLNPDEGLQSYAYRQDRCEVEQHNEVIGDLWDCYSHREVR